MNMLNNQTIWRCVLVLLATVWLAACSGTPPPVVVSEPETVVVPEMPAVNANGSIFQAQRGYAPLFEDRRPRMTGDILTIVLQEQVSATKSSEASSSRSSNMGINLADLPDVLDRLAEYGFNVGSDSNFLGQGAARANNTFQGTITVSVMEVLGNGNLRVRGEKQIAINQGAEYIRFSGVVNPRTISGQNTVLSTQVADARIEYIGDGYIHDGQRMGWFQRFFNRVNPF
ncbi:flagellar basal body L-ring protein FlgH [Aliidiomarina sanyensis]|uniref:Flagellar L-ring protein n=1 Tax=Aliidiomarina sanyensis TaxID=1249555 RepID=A0A432WPX1_9GAMM|nr:flagellar basal body L-ring protein FlgH [Aliidiomarina sanyensis]RUO35834.1 flagellar basal body L-ring protein [Aliidiomarina sanyensis]